MGSATYRAVSVPSLLSALNGIAGCGPSDTDYSLFSEYQSPDGKFTVSVETTGGAESVTGAFIRYDHLDGGVLFIPPTAQPMAAQRAVNVLVDGKWLATQSN